MTPTILIIENDPDSAKLMIRLLQAEGFHGEAVESAEEGLIRLTQRPFDLVLMDILLPRMDGKEATRRLRADPRFRGLPIVAVSAHVVGEQRQAILDSGVSALVTKPVDLDELLATIRALLAARPAPAAGESEALLVDTARTAARAAGLGAVAGVAAEAPAGARPAILIVENDPDSRKLMTRLLAAEGFHGEAVESAEEGLLRLVQRPFDLVLMDVMLPRMNGKEATRRLRADPRFRDLPIVAVSAHVVGEQRQAILDSGVSALATKPIDVEALLATIRRLLGPDAPATAPRVGAD